MISIFIQYLHVLLRITFLFFNPYFTALTKFNLVTQSITWNISRIASNKYPEATQKAGRYPIGMWRTSK